MTASKLTTPEAATYVTIRGRTLAFEELLTPQINSPELIATQRAAFCSNKPFEHLVIDGLFNEHLLNLIEEEFPGPGSYDWKAMKARYEATYRSTGTADFGPATQIYFHLVNSNAFVRYLSAITGISDLITDHTLLGGGLHETRAGGKFSVHRDFNFHHKTMLTNTLVLLTYLNKDWKPEYGGALELWDSMRNEKAAEVAPIFGRSIIFRHSDRSFHGHPTPLTPPPDRSRRSLGSYYYVNDLAIYRRLHWQSSFFLDELNAHRHSSRRRVGQQLAMLREMGVRGTLKYLARGITPPILWELAKTIRGSVQTRSSR